MRNLIGAAAIGLAISTTTFGVAMAQPAPAASMQQSFDLLVGALNNYSDELANLAALTTIDPTAVTLMDTGELVTGDNTTAYLDALGNADIAAIHAAVGANTVLAGILSQARVDLSDVVAISAQTNGQITIFFIADD
jgi:hypothetical protein